MKSGATQTVVATRRNENSSGAKGALLPKVALSVQNGIPQCPPPPPPHRSQVNLLWFLAWTRCRQGNVFRPRPNQG